MNYSTAVFLINDSARALLVTYAPEETPYQRQRHMVKTLDKSIDVDDFVVVPSLEGHKLTVAKVVAVDVEVDFDSMNEVFWIVCAIDFNNFNSLIAQEKSAVEKIKSAALLDKKRRLAESLMSAKQFKTLPKITGAKS